MEGGGGQTCKDRGFSITVQPQLLRSRPWACGTDIWETQNASSTVGAINILTLKLLASKKTLALTQQDDDAEKDGDQSPRAETHREKDGLRTAA